MRLRAVCHTCMVQRASTTRSAWYETPQDKAVAAVPVAFGHMIDDLVVCLSKKGFLIDQSIKKVDNVLQKVVEAV